MSFLALRLHLSNIQAADAPVAAACEAGSAAGDPAARCVRLAAVDGAGAAPPAQPHQLHQASAAENMCDQSAASRASAVTRAAADCACCAPLHQARSGTYCPITQGTPRQHALTDDVGNSSAKEQDGLHRGALG